MPEHFLHEGLKMLRAICMSLDETTDIRSIPILHCKSKGLIDIPRDSVFIDDESNGEIVSQLVQVAANEKLDAITVIAPELWGELAGLVSSLRQHGIKVWNCSEAFIELASDKWEVAQLCAEAGIAHPRTRRPSEIKNASDWEDFSGKMVVKPRDGAGCFALVVFENWREAMELLEGRDVTESVKEHLIVQDWIDGQACSRSVVSDGERYEIMPLVTQDFVSEPLGQHERGCRLNYHGARMASSLDERIGVELVNKTLACFPKGHAGWIGFDLVVDPQTEKCWLIEVNSRFTTSFAFLQDFTKRSILGQACREFLSRQREKG